MDNSLKLTALNQDMLVKLLKQSGCRIITAEMIQRDIDMGMPVNADGTINLISYMAWMIKEVNSDAANESE